jgi:uncharacterized protein (DUF2132 family)
MRTNHNQIFHGVTLQMILEFLVARYGWVELDNRIRINCFAINPSIKSSLVFLRRTPWARQKIEDLYEETVIMDERDKKQGIEPGAKRF